jgi:hypothetical protein
MSDANAVTTFEQGAFRNHPLVASAHAPRENRNTFEAFVRGFIGDLAPIGMVEATLAARAAGIAWRLNRAQGLETQVLTMPKGYPTKETALEDALNSGSTRQAVEMVARWEQGLERSLFKTLEVLDKRQCARRRRGNSRKANENIKEQSILSTNMGETQRENIDFDGEPPVFQSDPQSSSTL